MIRDDIGRPLTNFHPKVKTPKLFEYARRVLETGVAVANEVHGPNGTMYVERIAPYHDSGGDVRGVMILYSDVSMLLTARELQERINRLGIGSEVAVWEWPNTTEDGMWWSPDCLQMFGYQPHEVTAGFDWKSSCIRMTTINSAIWVRQNVRWSARARSNVGCAPKTGAISAC